LGPVGEFDFADMAKAFLAADMVLNDGNYVNIMTEVFNDRGILSSSEAKAWVHELRALPEVRLPDSINSAMASAAFFEEKVLPALKLPTDIEFIPMSAYRNAAGNAYLTYFTHRRITLDGSQFLQFNNSNLDVFGGLTLMFDVGSRLRSAFYRPVTDEDVRQIRILTAELIQRGMIASSAKNTPLPLPLHLYEEHPKGLWLPNAPFADAAPVPGQSKLVKFPVIFDTLPAHISDLWSYLKAWKK